jgi:hypothetical protein
MYAAMLAEELGDVEVAIDVIKQEVNVHSSNQALTRAYFLFRKILLTTPLSRSPATC